MKMTIKTKVKVGESGQIVIPKLIRESLGIIQGEELDLSVGDYGIVIKVVKENIADRLEKIAREENLDVEKDIKYGDELYSEIYDDIH
jgi:AbrB family looped-hinge helix DNA binding protein